MDSMRPAVFFVITFILLWCGVMLGSYLSKHLKEKVNKEEKLVSLLGGALLTFFGLLVGFTFSMAVSRYDARVKLIVKEANAIGTTWLRTSSLEDPARTQSQQLLKQYVAARIGFLSSGHDEQQLQASYNSTSDLQNRLWSLASGYALSHRDPITSLYMATLNDTIDVTEERRAALEDRIPTEAWGLLLFIGFAAMVVEGMNVSTQSSTLRILLPFVLAGAVSMTLDMDSPRYGLIRLTQGSMERVQQQITGNAP